MADERIQIKDLPILSGGCDDNDLLVLQTNSTGTTKAITKKDLLSDMLNNDKLINEINKVKEDFSSQLNSIVNTRFKNIFSITKNIQGKTVKLIGDSITAGVGSSDYSCTGETIYDTQKANVGVKCWAGKLKTYLENNFSCTVNNFGVAGFRSYSILEVISNLIKDVDDIIICMIGTNNRLVDNGITRLESDLKAIYEYVKNLGKEIIFISPIAGTLEEETSTGSVGATKYFQNYNVDNIYHKVCSELNIEYISLYKLLQDYLENTSTNLASILNSDQQHPTDEGYNILYNLILKSLGFSDRGNLDNVYDTGWVELTLVNGFTPKSSDKPCIRKIGNQVFLKGQFYWDSSVPSLTKAFQIPVGFTPSYEVDFEFNINEHFADGFLGTDFNIRSTNFSSTDPIQLTKISSYFVY